MVPEIWKTCDDVGWTAAEKGNKRVSEAGKRILLFGSTGTIGRATAGELKARGHEAVCVVRHRANTQDETTGTTFRTANFADPKSIIEAMRGERFDVVLSCMASRTGAPADAWAVDHDAHTSILNAAKRAGIPHFILLSAICVQMPLLEFQKAKLAFEDRLMVSGLDWTIARPTAFFKSLSGQVERVCAGKPFLIFGDGRLTACKPISDADLARFLVGCVEDQDKRNRVLPVGGPGPALTPRDQAQLLFDLTGQPPRIRRVPVAVLDGIITLLAALGTIFPGLRDKAEFARIGRYYATESMLVRDPESGAYDASATPEYGTDTLKDHYRKLLSGEVVDERGDHAVF